MSQEFEVVERALAVSRISPVSDALLVALVETARTGQAIKIDMSGKNRLNWQSTVRARLRHAGLRMRYKFNKTTKMLIAWTELLESEDTETVD